MQISFFSNFLNHHQTPFCDEMYKQLDGKFTFVSTEKTPESFLNNGYQDCTNYPYNLNSYKDETQYNRALQLGFDSDIVIIGSAPDIFIKERLRYNKLTFRYSERLLKKGRWMIFNPRVLYFLLKYHTRFRKKNLHMLCASAFTPNDLNLVFAYPQKKYKWGYFTAVEELDIEQNIKQKNNDEIQLLWVGRFIDWKHPEMPVKLAYKLIQGGYKIHLNMIGAGEEFKTVQKLIKKLNISEHVSLLGSMPNFNVKSYMKNSNIFLFTSDRNEGWGAVLNEAMSCGCAVVASNMIGAVPYLIKHKKNGLIYKSGNLRSLVEHTESLIIDQYQREKLSKNAYFTMLNEWNPRNAASKFLDLSKKILENKIISFENGPCSKADSMNKNPLKNK